MRTYNNNNNSTHVLIYYIIWYAAMGRVRKAIPVCKSWQRVMEMHLSPTPSDHPSHSFPRPDRNTSVFLVVAVTRTPPPPTHTHTDRHSRSCNRSRHGAPVSRIWSSALFKPRNYHPSPPARRRGWYVVDGIGPRDENVLINGTSSRSASAPPPIAPFYFSLTLFTSPVDGGPSAARVK